jgi:hypothetical protein
MHILDSNEKEVVPDRTLALIESNKYVFHKIKNIKCLYQPFPIINRYRIQQVSKIILSK